MLAEFFGIITTAIMVFCKVAQITMKFFKGTSSATYYKIAFVLRKFFVKNKVSSFDFNETQHKTF